MLEYTGDDPVWTQGEAQDWNFIKRYKDGYHLWVPDNLPSPNGDDPGHDIWTHVPEDGGAQMQGYYCLASDYTNAQVERGNDAEIVVVDPLMSEKATTAGPGEVDQIGASYGTVDSDSDDEWDGLNLYAYQSEDPAGTWRAIFCAEDKGGIHSPQWRTHDPLRMLTANEQSYKYCSANYSVNSIIIPGGAGEDGTRNTARTAQTAAGISRAHATYPIVKDDARDPNGHEVRTALLKADIVFLGPVHGSAYRAGYEGDAVETAALPGKNGLLCTTKDVLRWYWNRDPLDYYAYAVVDEYDEATDGDDSVPDVDDGKYYGLADGSYSECDFAFLSGCYTNRSGGNSICYVLRTRGGVRNVFGYTKAVVHHLFNPYSRKFWDKFGSPTYKAGWARSGITATRLQNCAQEALDEWWETMEDNFDTKRYVWEGYFDDSGLSYEWIDNHAVEKNTWVRMNTTDLQ